MSPNAQSRLFHALKVWLFFSAALSAVPIYLANHDWQRVHWLNADGEGTTATVIAYDRPVLEYSYTINRKDYAGRVKTSHLYEAGQKFDLFFSSSHPWISSLGKPPLRFEGSGYVVIVLASSLFVLIAAVSSLREKKST